MSVELQDVPTLRWLLDSVTLPPDFRPTSPIGWWSPEAAGAAGTVKRSEARPWL